MNDDELKKSLVTFRGYLNEFLNEVSLFYNIYVYSHGTSSYIKSILDIMDRKRVLIDRDRIITNKGNVD